MSPKNKIASLEKEGALIRLKKGVYLVSGEIHGKVFSRELIANHLYGPRMCRLKARWPTMA
jgi:predicted transcriptional regulator of viral defense system